MTAGAGTTIYNRQFWLLCASSLLFFGSFNMLIPELPAFLTGLGGAEYKGLIISLFTLTAMISRPFSGKLADTVGRVPVIVFGALVCFLCSLFYPLVTGVAGFLLLRLIHGFSTGFTPTGLSAYISDVVPSQRRGEAMGFLGTAGSLGMAFGPMLGGLIAASYGINAMFYTASLFGILSAAIVFSIRETLVEKQPFALRTLHIRKRDLFEPLVAVPCIVMALSAYSYGSVFTLIPDFGAWTGIQNKGFLFAFLTVSSLAVRFAAGGASDRYGRVPVLMGAMVVMAAGMTVTALAHSTTMLIAGITIYGLAHGATSPAVIAWATDISDEQHKGRAIASVYIFMEFGIGTGALASGFVYRNRPENFLPAFSISAVLAVAALVVLAAAHRANGRTRAAG